MAADAGLPRPEPTAGDVVTAARRPWLDALFEPGSVAVYGASATDPGKLGNTLLTNLAPCRSSWSVCTRRLRRSISRSSRCPPGPLVTVGLGGVAAEVFDDVADLLDRDPDVLEIDCNPVLVRDGRPVVLDALVVKR